VASDPRETFRFRDFELDVANCELRRQGRPIRLERLPMDLLILLVERRLQLVSRSDIVDRLWGKDVFIDVETGVNAAISKVRQALRDSPDAPAFVETVVGRGYRFIAPVEVDSGSRRAPSLGHPTVQSPAVKTDAASEEDSHPSEVEPASPAHRSRVPGRARVTVGLLTWPVRRRCHVGLAQHVRAPVSQVTPPCCPSRTLAATEHEYLADGLAEETTRRLAGRSEHFSVVGRT
jgi:DNA-binding winged helix-turn-helix (wHTH) protein